MLISVRRDAFGLLDGDEELMMSDIHNETLLTNVDERNVQKGFFY